MKWKAIIGVILIVCSVAGLYFWETRGRDEFLLRDVVVCSDGIRKGERLESGDLKIVRVPPEAAEGGLLPAEAALLLGRLARHDIAAGQLIFAADFAKEPEKLPAGQSVFVLPASWIYSRSAALRAGDTVGVYLMEEERLLGSYPVAFVRDASELSLDSDGDAAVLDRGNLSGVISSVEIVCSRETYFSLYETVQQYGPSCLLLVMEGA